MTNELQPEIVPAVRDRNSSGTSFAVRILRNRCARSGWNLRSRKSLRKMPAAQWYVAIVAADFDLRSFAFGGAIGLDTYDHDGLASAMTDGLDLDQVVSPAQELGAAREELPAEVRPQSVTQHR